MLKDGGPIPLRIFAFAVLFWGALSWGALTQADALCFAQAQSYYEQIYCEVKAEGKGARLPRFHEFKRNDQLTQALLLKRPAQNAGVDLAMPKPAKAKTLEFSKVNSGKVSSGKAVPAVSALSDCSFRGLHIACGKERFKLVGNKNNKHLRPGALDESNGLALPLFKGAMTDSRAVNRYLAVAYPHYVDKMLMIGLGGATMSYGKFEYLFSDLHQKGVSFNDRFETMYRYLKKDKRTIGVNESISVDSDITINDCGPLARHVIACARNGRNYLYLTGEAP